MAWFNGIWKRTSLFQVLQGQKGDKGDKGDPGLADVAKTFTYDQNGVLTRITSIEGTKTLLYNNGRLERINGTGTYKTKEIIYVNNKVDHTNIL